MKTAAALLPGSTPSGRRVHRVQQMRVQRIFAEDPLLGVPRPSSQDRVGASLAEILRIVGPLRTDWTEGKIVLRADWGLLPGRDHGLLRSQSGRFPLWSDAQRARVPDH